jgi:hypothetical protein
MNDVRKVRIQLKAPRGNFGGEIAEKHYMIVENFLVFTDANGKPLDTEKHYLSPGADPHIVAYNLLRQRRSGPGPAGWNRPIQYPRTGKI